jgi:hypothetical protein
MFGWGLRRKPVASERADGGARERVEHRLETSARERIEREGGPRREPRVCVARPGDLLQMCIALAVRGADFYEVYDDVLRPSPLIDSGVAVLMADQGAVRKVPLRRGGAFVFSEATRQWSLDRRPFLH